MYYHIPESLRDDWSKEIESTVNIGAGRRAIVHAYGDLAESYLSSKLPSMIECYADKGVIILTGMPVHNEDRVEPDNQVENILTIGAASLLGFTKSIGLNPFSYLQEKKGALVHDVAPINSHESEQSSNGKVDFQMHTDCAWLEEKARPDALALACVVNESTTGTRLAPLDRILDRLGAEVRQVLEGKNFAHGSPASFDLDTEDRVGPILHELDGRVCIRAAFHTCRPLNSNAWAALKALCEITEDVSFSIPWKPGDLVLFDNRRFMHGRSAIRGRRWLLRCYGSKSFEVGDVVDIRSLT